MSKCDECNYVYNGDDLNCKPKCSLNVLMKKKLWKDIWNGSSSNCSLVKFALKFLAKWEKSNFPLEEEMNQCDGEMVRDNICAETMII